MDDKLLDGYLGDAAGLEEMLPWGSLLLDYHCDQTIAAVRALVAEVRRLRRRNDDGACRGCGHLSSSCSCGAAPVACHACGHYDMPCQCPEVV